MKLFDLLAGIDYETGLENLDIADVVSDSRKVVEGCVFVCIKGLNVDGHEYAAKALEQGAAAVVCERDMGLEKQILCKNTRLALALMCSNFFGRPSDSMKVIGVTGTNGKTTVSKLVKKILETARLKVGLIGTIQNEIGDREIPASQTTPDPYELQKLLAQMRDEKCDFVVMEVSSHALDQHRVGGMKFDFAVFTNLTQDHLDYHQTMENYFSAKKMLFDIAGKAVINCDDPYGQRILKECACKSMYTYSIENPDADFLAEDITSSLRGVSFMLKSEDISSKIDFSMPGLHSVHNALAAAGVCILAGVCRDKVTKTLNGDNKVKGRSEIIPTGKDFTVICDYAHTPDGLLNILPSVRGYTKGRLITLFGCGGDRDKAKRPLMGEAAAVNSDLLIVTSDNPRTEDPEKIIEDILEGVRKHNTEYTVIPDRRQAIYHAIKIAKAGDVIVLAGKGHEDYQILNGKTIHFDEREIVKQALSEIYPD